jgi:O-antigen/teichoic acid export membrane protein
MNPIELELPGQVDGARVVKPPVEVSVQGLHIKSLALRLVRGSLTYAVANFAVKALNLLLLPLYTRFLSPADYGIISLAETLAAALAVGLGLGLDSGVTRLYFQYVSDPPKLNRYVSSCLRFAAIWTLTSVTVMLLVGGRVFTWIAPHSSVPFYPFIAMAIGAAAFSQIIQYRFVLYQVQQRALSYAFLAIALFFATTTTIVVLVVFARWGAFGMLFAKLVAAASVAVGVIRLLRPWIAAPLEWKFVRETLKLSLPLIPHYIMALCLVTADRFILAHYRSLQEVGLYSLAYTLGMAMFLVSVSIGQAWQPIYYDTARRDGGRHTLGKISSSLAVLLTAIAILGVQAIPYFARLLDSRYLPIMRLIPWVIGGYLLHAFLGLFQLALMEGKRTKFIVVASSIAFVLNLALNFWWIPSMGMYGAAYATLVAYGAEALLMYFYAQHVFYLPYDWGRMAGALTVFALALGLSQFSWNAYLHGVLTLGMLLIAAAMVWFAGGKRTVELFEVVLNEK